MCHGHRRGSGVSTDPAGSAAAGRGATGAALHPRGSGTLRPDRVVGRRVGMQLWVEPGGRGRGRGRGARPRRAGGAGGGPVCSCGPSPGAGAGVGATPPARGGRCDRRSGDAAVGGTDVVGSPATWRGLASVPAGGHRSGRRGRQSVELSRSGGRCGESCRSDLHPRCARITGVVPGPVGSRFREEVVVRRPPDRAGPPPWAAAAGAPRAPPLGVRLVRQQQRAQPAGQPRQFGASHRFERTVIGVQGQFVEHVEPLPYRPPEDLPQNPVHLVTLPAAVRLPKTCPWVHSVRRRDPEWGRGAPIGSAVTVSGKG